ncbi:MAG: DNA primase [Candidatus Kerfeldbacteria bacterium]|nr:DNA primase [Candidatus Kerfeldbacteria bacterium]
MADPVQEIKDRLNIVELIQEYIPLKKAGVNYKANCPFHNEKTPSFTVSEPKQFFHCFGCQKGGDLFTFVQEMEQVEFPEALRMLAQKANVELRGSNPREHNERTRLLDCLSKAAEFFSTTFAQRTEAEHVRRYIADRGVTEETATLFQLGYSLDSWDALLQTLKKAGFTDTEIEKAGLSIRSPKTGGWYDRFRGRVMFPIHNAHGNVIGFGARTLEAHPKEAKYINSPQTAVYNKSAVLYGLHLAKQAIQRMDAAVVVEGYMDVIAAHQAKFRNVVAASGTALTEEQIRLLKRYSSNIILAFDADTAGLHAAWRGMQIAIQQGMNIKVLALPAGLDPDDLIRQDPQEFRKRAIEAKPFMDYAFDTILAPLDLTNVHHKKKAAAELLPMIALFPDPIEQTHYVKLLANILEVNDELILQRLKLKPQPRSSAQRQKTASVQAGNAVGERGKMIGRPSRDFVLFDRILALLTLYPEGFSEVRAVIPQESELIQDSLLQALYKSLELFYNQHGSLQPQAIDFHNDGNVALAAKWQELQLIGEEEYIHNTAQQRAEELRKLLDQVKRSDIKRRLTRLGRDLQQAEKTHDVVTIEKLSQDFAELTNALRSLG